MSDAVTRTKAGQFVKGWGGGPGRPPGKRNYLTEVVIEAVRTSPLGHLTDEELAMLEEMLTAGRAKLIEQHKGAAAALEPADTKHPDKP